MPTTFLLLAVIIIPGNSGCRWSAFATTCPTVFKPTLNSWLGISARVELSVRLSSFSTVVIHTFWLGCIQHYLVDAFP